MNVRPKRISLQRGISLLAALLALLVPAAALFAQTPPIAQKLPPSTVCFVEWRGMALLAGADKRNHLLQLLEDPDFASPPDLSWLKLLKPEVVSRHLHVTLSEWWKDSNGVYFDSYLQ